MTREGARGADAGLRDRAAARASAERTHIDALLNQWLRETHAAPENGRLVLAELVSSGRELSAIVDHHSPTGVHRFSGLRACYPAGPLPGAEERTGDDPVTALELAELLGREAAFRGGARPGWDGAAAAERLLADIARSLRALEKAEFTAPRSADGPVRRPVPIAPFDAGAHGDPRAEVLGVARLWWVAEPEERIACPPEARAALAGLPGVPAAPEGALPVPRLGKPEHGARVLAESEVWVHEDGRTVELASGVTLVVESGTGVEDSVDEDSVDEDSAPDDAPHPARAPDGPLRLDTTAVGLTVRHGPVRQRVRFLTGRGDGDPGRWRSLGALLAEGGGGDAVEWFAGYLDALPVPLIRHWARTGAAYAPALSDVLVLPDDDGRIRAARCDDGHRLDDPAADPATVVARVTHQLLRDHVLALAGLLGAAGLADEYALLRTLAARIEALATELATELAVESAADSAVEEGPAEDRVADVLRGWLADPVLPLRTSLMGGLLNPEEVFRRPGAPAVYQLAANPLWAPARDGRAAAAAARTAAVRALGVPPVPRLTDGWALRPVLPDDGAAVDLVHRWMNTPHVADGWRQAWTREHWHKEIAEQHAGTWVRPYLVAYQGRDIAYLEVYRNLGHPMASCYRVRTTDVGFHMAIGEPSGINQGVAATVFPMMIRALLAAEPSCDRIVGEPNVRNGAMRRSMVKTKWPIVREIALAHKNAMLVVYERGAELAGDDGGAAR